MPSTPPLPHRHHAHPSTLAAIAAGGAVGSVLRWLLELGLPADGGWPWATLLTNVVGSAALAVLVVRGDRLPGPHWLRPGLGTGLLGGFTTFSTYAVQVHLLGSTAPPTLVLLYLLLTPALCVAAAAVAGTLASARGPV